MSLWSFVSLSLSLCLYHTWILRFSLIRNFWQHRGKPDIFTEPNICIKPAYFILALAEQCFNITSVSSIFNYTAIKLTSGNHAQVLQETLQWRTKKNQLLCSYQSWKILLKKQPAPFRRTLNAKRDAYHFCEAFNLKAEAMEVIGQESWGQWNRSDSREGEQLFFRCNIVKFRGDQCTARVFLLFDAVSPKVLLYRSDAEYSCESIETKSGAALTDEVKTTIEQCVDTRMKNCAIIDRLAQLNQQGMDWKLQMGAS